MNARYVSRMILDLDRYKFVYISLLSPFSPIGEKGDTEFGFLLDCGEGGEIKFNKLDLNLISVEAMNINNQILNTTTMTFDQFKIFAEYTVSFAIFLCDNGDEALNL